MGGQRLPPRFLGQMIAALRAPRNLAVFHAVGQIDASAMLVGDLFTTATCQPSACARALVVT